MGITQKEIADALDLPLITVHRALNSSGYVSKELKGRILAYAREVRYVPHKASQILKRNKVRKIAIFSSSLPHYFWNDIRTGISIGAEQIQALNYRVNYHSIAERDSEQYLLRLEEEIRDGVEAVAFVNQWIYRMDDIITRITRAGLPYVTLNVDAPESRRLCYIGPDYRAGGRLAAEYIGKTLQCMRRPRVLVLTTLPESRADARAPDINALRFEGFCAVMKKSFPDIGHETASITKGMRSPAAERHIAGLLEARTGGFDAVYLVAAYNAPFIRALEESSSGRRVVVLHDLDSSSNHYLERNLLTSVVYQNPILQGYYTVRILEDLLESGHPPEVRQINIVHSIILNENKDLYKNHYLFARMHE
jgi:LacI family transcriptional regulator